MFWQEDDNEKDLQIPDDVVDVLFSIDCKRLPVDHAYALSAALRDVLPWVGSHDSGVAVHAVHVAGSQNGWERPAHGSDRHLIVSRRTKLTIRVSKERMDELMENLKNKTLDISGCRLTVREGKVRPLSKETTLFSRYVASLPDQSEDGFLAWAVQELKGQGIGVRKALCGKTTSLTTPNGAIHTRSLMLADLSPEESARLQRGGLGPHREMGCGIFIPHKGIDAVKKTA
jgi:CRISPR-associated protein Cas6